MYLLVCVLDNPAHLSALLEQWANAGVLGITILDSTGIERVRRHLREQAAPLFMGFSRLLRSDQYSHNTLFAVVQDMATVQRAVAATERVTGDLAGPHTGIVFAIPVAGAWGLPKHYVAAKDEEV